MAVTKTINGQELPSSAFLYVPDPEKPSTWKLPVKNAAGEPDLGRVAAAAAALSPGGFRGKRVDIPKAAMADVKKRLISMYKRLGRTKDQIPSHLYEQKALEELPALPATSQTNLRGSVRNIEEVEYKGRRGLAIEAIMNSLGPDTYNDWALLTPELQASTEKYFNTHPLSLIQHAKPYRGLDGSAKPPVLAYMGYTIDHSYEEDGIHIHDFVPEPDGLAPTRVREAYNELKAGEFDGISVNGWFYRDTGLHSSPGIIIDWDIIEHSYCRNCVDPEAAIIDIAELKAISADTENWSEEDQNAVHSVLTQEFNELKARIEPNAISPPDSAVAVLDLPDPTVDTATPTSEHAETPPDSSPESAYGEPEARSGMDLYRSDTVYGGVPQASPDRGVSAAHVPQVPIPALHTETTRATELTQPVSTSIQYHFPQNNPIQAEDKSPAPLFGGTMNDTVQTSGQNVSENELVQQLLARVNAMESEKKALEQAANQERLDKEAREEAERTARQIAEAAAQAEAEQKARVEKYTAEALSRWQINPVGNRYSMPVGAGASHSGNAGAGGNRPRYTMAGPVVEEKARNDADGNSLPVNMIDWIMDVKAGKRQAQFLSWTEKFGSEAKAVTMGVPGAQTNSPAGSAGGFALPVQYLEEIVPLLIDQFSIRSLISTYPANSILLEVPRMATRATRAVVTAEGDTKPKRQFGTDMIAIRLYTVPQIVDVTNQLLNFSRETAEQIVREQMADAIRLAEFFYALQGTGTNEPFGLIPALVAADAADATQNFVIHQASGTQPTGAAVPNTETLPDVIARGINVTQLRYYDPDALLVHPNIFWKLISTKDSYGRYLVDGTMTGQINSIWGIRVLHTTQIPMGRAVVGNWKKLRMYIAQDVTVDVTNEAGDRWDRNLTGFRIEEMIGLDARQELNAFTLIDFTTAGVASS